MNIFPHYNYSIAFEVMIFSFLHLDTHPQEKKPVLVIRIPIAVVSTTETQKSAFERIYTSTSSPSLPNAYPRIPSLD
jgi:hypothetical protein